MTTPQLFMAIFAGSGVLAVLALLTNFYGLVTLKSLRGLGILLHLVFGLWAGASWVGFIISTIFVLIDYAKA